MQIQLRQQKDETKVLDQYLTVTALTKYIKKKLDIDPHLQQVWLKGEISNFKHHNRGHMYLTLKDNHSRIQSVMFAGNNRSLKFTPENGMNVLIKGHVSVFEPYGQYQLYIKSMEPDGIGSLYLAFEQLKEKLAKEGLFDEVHKQVIPTFPKRIGIITSPTGAAVRDIITTIKRRFTNVELTVIPVIVQGEHATDSIVEAITLANRSNEYDTLILGRGGGSIEDLWSFNEEAVVRTIFASNIPIISAVGHETDTTISDFVADLRAPTPTAAAEMAVPSKVDVEEHIRNLTARLYKMTQLTMSQKKESLQIIRGSYALHYPKHLINEKEQYVDRLQDDMMTSIHTLIKQQQYTYHHLITRLQHNHPEARVQQTKKEISHSQQALIKTIQLKLQQIEGKLTANIEKLMILNPLQTMHRGFSVTYDQSSHLIKSVDQVNLEDQVTVQLTDGSFLCTVDDIRRDSNNGK